MKFDDPKEQAEWEGLLSRLESSTVPQIRNTLRECVLTFSGPEPQTSIVIGNLFAFFNTVFRQAKNDKWMKEYDENHELAKQAMRYIPEDFDDTFRNKIQSRKMRKKKEEDKEIGFPEEFLIIPQKQGFYDHVTNIQIARAKEIVDYLTSDIFNLVAMDLFARQRPRT